MRDLYRDTVVMTDPTSGALMSLAGVEVYVYNAGTSVKATIYQGREGAAQVTNPFTTTANGLAEFYAEEGRYDIKYVDTVSPPRTGEIIKLWNAVDPIVDSGDLDATVMAQLVPVGMMAPFGGSAAPSGWKLCDGSPISRFDFDPLWRVIGITYGAGDGISTFNLPDLRGRVPVGVDGAAGRLTSTAPLSNADLLGQSGGFESHVLTTAESGMAGHTHSGTLPDHSHSGADHWHYASASGGGGTGASQEGTISRVTGATGAVFSGQMAPPGHTHYASVSVTGSTGWASGGGSGVGTTGGINSAPAIPTGGPLSPTAAQAHRSMPPYQIVNYIIKY